MVPTARLELARLSSLPPQDSVSTNSTTSALHGTRMASQWNSNAYFGMAPDLSSPPDGAGAGTGATGWTTCLTLPCFWAEK